MNPLREKAIKLRVAGYSYNMIKERLGVPKSTLSNWLSRIPFVPNREVIARVGRGKLKSALFKQRLKFESIERAKQIAKKDIGFLSKRDLFILGIGLYLGEGEKTYENVRIVNSDPKIIQLAIKWFYNACGVKKENFRPSIHLYPDNNIKISLRFWSNITKIQIPQFGKTIIDQRKNKSTLKRRKLPHGTLHLYVMSNGLPHLGVNLHRKIQAWIEECVAQIKI